MNRSGAGGVEKNGARMAALPEFFCVLRVSAVNSDHPRKGSAMTSMPFCRWMKLMPLLLAALVTGCDYTVPLVATPNRDIDRSLVGLWQRTKEDGQVEKLLVLPLGPRDYLVAYPANDANTMFARGCLWTGSGLTLVQLDWFGTAKGATPDDAKTFQYAAYTVATNTLSVRMLDIDTVKDPATNGGDLARAIAEKRGEETLFRSAMDFTRAEE